MKPKPPPSPPSPPAPPLPPSEYEFYRCYLQVAGKKFVRLYSQTYQLMANAQEGSCFTHNADGGFHCGASACNPNCDQLVQDFRVARA